MKYLQIDSFARFAAHLLFGSGQALATFWQQTGGRLAA
jgi:hypothetical protein